jgi:hypothetical protein
MAQSYRDKIIAAAVAALNAPGDKPATAYRTRTDAFAQTELPAMLVYPVREQAERAGRTVSKRTLLLRVEVMTSGDAPQDAVLDPVLVYVVRTLYADANFLGMILALEEQSIEWQVEGGELDYAIAVVDFALTYTSQVDDPTVRRI